VQILRSGVVGATLSFVANELLRSDDVPQANSLERIPRLVRFLVRGELRRLNHEFRERDYAFYHHAARILRLLDEENRPTRLGHDLADLADGEVWAELARAFKESVVGSAWLRWQGVADVRLLDSTRAKEFMRARANFAARDRRASTLRSWVEKLRASLPPFSVDGSNSPAPVQLLLSGVARGDEGPAWPPVGRFPHNEGAASARQVIWPALVGSKRPFLIAGYTALDQLLAFFAERPIDGAPGPARLLLGSEPFPISRPTQRRTPDYLSREMKDYWLEQGISITFSAPILHAKELISRGRLLVGAVRGRRPLHAKMYLSDDSVVVGSSNFTIPGLAGQTEANVRFTETEKKRADECRAFAEALWTRCRDYSSEFVDLLDALLRSVTWQEALARACASLLEGEWAKRYVPPEMLEKASPPLWPHQLQGISQAMWVLENVGSVLVADATGSGKTRMGAWLICAAFDRQYRRGFVRRPSPLVVVPPQVVPIWEAALYETGLPFPVHSHGPLSNERAAKHDFLLRGIVDTELLAVDEAHNYLNTSARTDRLVSHYAENAILFTATPINRSAADILALVELLGADNFSDRSIEILMDLRRPPSRRRLKTADAEEDLGREVRRFTVRRTRHQLNAIADRYEREYTLGSRRARYPKHVAKYYACASRPSDHEIACKIRALAESLKGVSWIPRTMQIPEWWARTDSAYVDQVLASARALARHHVLDSLRSSRAALVEHALGTAAAADTFLPRRSLPPKALSGDMAGRTKERSPPAWQLDSDRASFPGWLWDSEQHAAARQQDSDTYRRIGELASQLSADREEAKTNHLCTVLQGADGPILAFDSHVITLRVLEHLLVARGERVECLTGEGGSAAKKRAARRLGLDAKSERLIALCSDAFSEGYNLQRASCVVHLNTPTVIRTAEQRAGRVDRMNSPHDEVQIWWPRDDGTFAPLRRDILRARHETVRDLIGANLTLPDESDESGKVVAVEDLAAQGSIDAAESELDESRMYDAFRPVRDLIIGDTALVSEPVYEEMRASQAEIVACVCAVESTDAWAFLCVGSLARAAPQWVLFSSLDADPKTDLAEVAEGLRARLNSTTAPAPRNGRSEHLIRSFADRLRATELSLLPVRRRRALALLQSAIDEWSGSAGTGGDEHEVRSLGELRMWLAFDADSRRSPFPDPRSVSDAWLRVIRPRVEAALKNRRRRRSRPWRLNELLPSLVKSPIPAAQLWKAFERVPMLQPADQRVVSMIIGVPRLP
jgi:helicase-like protein/SNF2 domain-containing protein